MRLQHSAPAFKGGDNRSLWLVARHRNGPNGTALLVLAVTQNGDLGSNPIFIASCVEPSSLDWPLLGSCIEKLVHTLKENVLVERVFSVFAFHTIARGFAQTWTSQTGIGNGLVYYNAILCVCSKKTLRDSEGLPTNLQDDYFGPFKLEWDGDELSRLCLEFAKTSVRYISFRP